MGNMNFCPVAFDTRRHYGAADQAEAYEHWFDHAKAGLIDNAERGLDTNWLERGDNWRFGEKVAAILADESDDKLGRIRELWRLMVDAWAETETIKGMAK